MKIKQHSVYMVKLGWDGQGHEQQGDRPFYVVSSDEYNERSQTPIGFFLSTSEKKSQNRFTVQCDIGWINCTQVRTLSSDRVIRFMGTVDKGITQSVMEYFIKEVM